MAVHEQERRVSYHARVANPLGIMDYRKTAIGRLFKAVKSGKDKGESS